MLRRLGLRDFVIVTSLEVEVGAGFTVLTGETGAGKSILVDALQLALGSRGDAGVVREGRPRADISAEFDLPPGLRPWLDEAGFLPDADGDGERLLLRRTIDGSGKSRAWINGGSATVAQLREVADHLVDIHGQHAWQSLTRPPAVRALLDAYARLDTAPLARAHADWKAAQQALDAALSHQAEHQRERERLAWQIGELERLAPGPGEWEALEAEHRRLSNAQALIEAARGALDAVGDGEPSAGTLTQRALRAIETAAALDAGLAGVVEALMGAQAQLQDAAHALSSYLHATEPEPQRLQQLDERLGAWIALARRHRRPPADLPDLLAQWTAQRQALDDAADPAALAARRDAALAAYDREAARISAARRRAAPQLAASITQAMQQLGMAGGRFEVALEAQEAPQSWGRESAEFLVAGHAGSTPRPMARIASGGELSRIALAVAVTTARLDAAPGDEPAAAGAGTLIFDEIDAGVGGAVAETVGRLMKQLGADRQVLAVTHLPQVAACADHHLVVQKAVDGGAVRSEVQPVAGEARVAEIARMLGGERLSGTSRAHAQEMLAQAAGPLDETPSRDDPAAPPPDGAAPAPAARAAGRPRARP
ncbi:DNA repair protein RecN [Piscinibacter sakaiensis]|uniref:DNA repair protein RecN n=1 Tax=Piscinibacter sakaiensis TaxID=1547922 RepID=A0A0K8NXH5_PISS1|nr:DNA repair protein RecN [Piscinibacter sakaiensis]GAP35102.1 DNA repair protein RecN [Piscinibacter sakaiensis]